VVLVRQFMWEQSYRMMTIDNELGVTVFPSVYFPYAMY
jgi:hypothetical protein